MVFYPDAEVLHYGSQTVGQGARQQSEFFKAYLNFFRRHRSRPMFYALTVSATLVFSLRYLGALLRRDAPVAAQCRQGIHIALRWLTGRQNDRPAVTRG